MSGDPLKAKLPDMEESEFAQWQSLLEQRTGVWIPPHRKAFLVTKLMLRMREHHLVTYREYYKSLISSDWAVVEWAYLVDLLTVHETRFCRDVDGLNFVYRHCQGIFEKNRRRKRLDLWSVGCSTGEEVYGLAMLMADLVNDMKGKTVYFGVTGMDISFPTLAKARTGVYPKSGLKHLRADWRERYVIENEDDTFEIDPKLKRRVHFVQGNIKELDNVPKHTFDVIYCQNVLIYFQQPQRWEILDNLAGRLAAGGVLVLGPGEVSHWKNPSVVRVEDKNCLAYTKLAEPT